MSSKDKKVEKEAEDFSILEANPKTNKPKQEPKKTPKKEVKAEPKEEKKEVENKPYAYIGDFIRSAKSIYGLDSVTISGFKAYMNGKHYLKDEKDFIQYLDKYLGKED